MRAAWGLKGLQAKCHDDRVLLACPGDGNDGVSWLWASFAALAFGEGGALVILMVLVDAACCGEGVAGLEEALATELLEVATEVGIWAF